MYNTGRVLTYSVLGAVAGIFGKTLAMAGFQKAVSITSGAFIIVLVAWPFLVKENTSGFLYRWTSAVKMLFRKLFSKNSPLTMFFIGSVNGLLPCGFVYLAMAASIAMGSIAGSAGYMLLFGLGTWPMMLALSLGGGAISTRYQSIFRRAVPFIAAALGVWLIYRGIMIESHSCCHR